jgi:P27 family predicted phage terminase small subunit
VQGGGTLRRRDVERAKRAPRPGLGVGEPPELLTDEQREIWKRVVANAAPGLLAACDRDVVVSYCVAISMRDAAARGFVESGGAVLVSGRDKRDEISNPHVREFRRSAMLVRVLATELGFSPASRSRVSVVPPPDGDDPLDRFLPKG